MTQDTEQKPKLPDTWRKIHKRTNEHMLFAEDIGKPGTMVDVEIAYVTIAEAKNEDGVSKMPALAFVGSKSGKVLGLNKTNCKFLTTACGTDDPNEWSGWITLWVKEERIGGNMENVIRIIPKRPAGKVAK